MGTGPGPAPASPSRSHPAPLQSRLQSRWRGRWMALGWRRAPNRPEEMDNLGNADPWGWGGAPSLCAPPAAFPFPSSARSADPPTFPSRASDPGACAGGGWCPGRILAPGAHVPSVRTRAKGRERGPAWIPGRGRDRERGRAGGSLPAEVLESPSHIRSWERAPGAAPTGTGVFDASGGTSS